MLIDTHAHLNFNAYKDDTNEIIQRTLKNNVWLINVGSQYSTSKRAVEIAEKYEQGVYATVGLHPIHIQDNFGYQEYYKLAKSKKVMAIGEIGLDYKPEYLSFKKQQKQVFLEQLDLAKELKLPVIFHCRMAHAELIEILKARSGMLLHLPGVIHCFTGTLEQAEQYIEMGLYLGFNGLIFKMNQWDEVIKKIPLAKILLETDCPYLPPPEFVGQRNEPLYVKYIAERIAKIKNISYQEVAKTTTLNAKKLFNL